MIKKSLDSADLESVLRGGFTYLELNRTLLDNLNVFPVPDGDTGANMASTLASGIETFGEKGLSINEMGVRFNAELNRCSRGNSGFILARFFHGFFETLRESEDLSASDFTRAVANGSYHVNEALFSPVEGTMISILSAVCTALSRNEQTSMFDALKLTVETGTKALFLTPKQLPVLARAGVVDSGALGLLFIFRGMFAALTGAKAVLEDEGSYRLEPDPDASDADEDDSSYRYCTEAVVLRNGDNDKNLDDWLRSMGNSIALVKEDKLLKIHIHTNEPQAVFDRLEKLGHLEHTKIDDMQEQTRLVSADDNTTGGMSTLAFVPGEGFERIYEDLGVSDCFIYGETLPSPEEISEALNRIDSEHIIVMPNNSNILPSVMAVRDLTDKKLSIIPTKTVIQGITASYGFSADETVTENVESMTGFINDALGLFVYQSTLNTKFGNADLKIGDWFVTQSKEVLGVGESSDEAVSNALKTLKNPDITDIAIYHGDGFDPRDIEKVIEKIRTVLPDADVEDHFGGQNRAAL
ncbi:MAG: DAK2 domain-containing protein, partial [Spirochaetaceae bacterium]|nr:DAK2 domain-containing protein [Spirochaetaceae bacterium]